jgi:hypothetical protein
VSKPRHRGIFDFATGLHGSLFAAIVASLALLLARDAAATSYATPQRSDVRFDQWVARTDQIVLARVVSLRSLPATPEQHALPFPPDPFEFTLETVEAIKGKPPHRFTLTGRYVEGGWNDNSSDRVAQRHTRIGEFWTLFVGGSDREPFMLNAEYLVFRNKDGSRPYMAGRDAELIPARDDPWLLAVRRLARSPALRYGRKATVLDFLTSSTAVVVTETLTCFPDPAPANASFSLRPDKQKIVQQLWGAPVEVLELEGMYVWGISETCDKGQQRLVVVQSRRWNFGTLKLKVSPPNRSVDFGGFAHGSDEGQIPESVGSASLWQAEVEITGKTKWSVAELDAALRQIASGREVATP